MKNTEAARLVVIGAICGDIIGSWYERVSTKRTDFEMFSNPSGFTDDTVCTIGIADALVHNEPFDKWLRFWCRRYPRAGYGGMFHRWFLSENMGPYNSWGNGSAMRVSPVGAIANSFEEAKELAKQSAEMTHNHPEGIKGAQAVACAIHYALIGKTKKEIKKMIETTFGYDLSKSFKYMTKI